MLGGIWLTYRNISSEMNLARLKSDFVANVSHELRTPLALIRLYAETLELGRITSKEKYQEYFRIIREESERLTALINNILDFSRIEAGRKEYEFKETEPRRTGSLHPGFLPLPDPAKRFCLRGKHLTRYSAGKRGPRSHRAVAAQSGEQCAEILQGSASTLA